MIKLKITYSYNNQKFNSLEDAVYKVMRDGIIKIVEEKLNPFEAEINKQRGEVVYNFTDEKGNGTVTVKNVTEDLRLRIESALT